MPSNVKVGGMGALIDLPLGHKDNPWSFDHIDTLTIALPDAPRLLLEAPQDRLFLQDRKLPVSILLAIRFPSQWVAAHMEMNQDLRAKTTVGRSILGRLSGHSKMPYLDCGNRPGLALAVMVCPEIRARVM